MSFTNWLRAFQALSRPGTAPASPPRHCPRAGARFRHRPRLEQLEDRTLLSVFGQNLIVDGDAEAVVGSASGFEVVHPPGWSTMGNFTVGQYGSFPTPFDFPLPSIASPGPNDRGQNLFVGGPSNVRSLAAQNIDVWAGATTIDAGGVTFTLAGYLGGLGDQNDNAVLTATFLDASGSALPVQASLGPVLAIDRLGQTGLVPLDTGGLVPRQTRWIALNLEMARRNDPANADVYNNAYADNLSLILTAPPGNLVPTITGHSDNSKPEGSAAFSLTVSGTDFVGDSIVLWNGAALPTTFVSDTQLQAIVPAADLTEEGGAVVTVSNPAPGGGMSNPFIFLIQDAALNVAPPSFSATEGVSFSGPVATFTDPGGDEAINNPGKEYTATINWGEAGGTDEAATVTHRKTGGFAVSGSHTYADEGPHNVIVWVTHGATVTVSRDAATGTYTFPPGLPLVYTSGAAVTVADWTPVVNAGSGATLDAGQTFARSGSFSDPSADTWTATVNYGDGSGDQPLALNADKTFALSHPYPTAGSYTLTVKVRDDEGTIGSSTLTITVNATTPRPAPAPAPAPALAPARAITASLVTRKHKMKKTLFVHIVFADTGALKAEVRSPFQNPAFQAIRAVAADSDGDGVPDTVRVSARKGKKAFLATLAV